MVYLYDSFHNLYVRNVVQLSRKFYILELLPYKSIGGTMLELKPMIHKFKMKDKYFCLDVNSGIIHVIDFKYGQSPNGRVEAEGNPQLALYALGAYETYKILYPIENDHQLHYHSA